MFLCLLLFEFLFKYICSQIAFHRDFQNFLSILLDDTIRQTICRLWFNGEKKHIGFIGENKKEIKYEISQLDDIFNYSDQIIKATEKMIKSEKLKLVEESADPR